MSFHIVPIAEADVLTLIKSIDKVIINPIIIFLFAVAIVFFLYGVAQYLLSPENEELRKKSKSHMIWGVVGLFIMVAVFGIMRLLLSTFGETKIQVNTSGEFNVSDTTIENKPPVGSTEGSDQNLFNGGLDVTNPSLKDAPVLPPDVFTTSPLATYEANPALCWNNNNKPFYGKASTEYNALSEVNITARSAYLNYLKKIDPTATDKSNLNYPITFASIVLYDQTTKTYHAWLDARAPVAKGGRASDCNLKRLIAPRELPESIVFSQIKATDGEVNLSETVIKSNILDFTKSPFTQQYKPNPVCWRKELYANSDTEFNAIALAKIKARFMFLNENNLGETTTPENLPIVYGSLTAYDKVTKNYYVWLDTRAPIKTGKVVDCDLVRIGEPEILPTPIAQSGKPNPLSRYTSDGKFYRVVDSGSDPDYYVARSIAINNALIQIAHLKGLTNVAGVTSKTILEEKYYPQDPFTLLYDYWVAIESPI